MRRIAFGVIRGLVQALSGWRLRRFSLVDRAYELGFTRLRPEIARAHGHRLRVDRRDQVVARGLLLHGTWEPFLTEAFLRLLRPGMVVFCLGAHIGYFTLLAARAVGPAGRVYAFEPAPDSFRLLVQNVELNGYHNVVAVPMAVSNRTGKARLYLHPSNTGDHQLHAGDEPRPSLEVDAVRLDDWITDRERAADVIQMDLQGSEMLAVEGMEDLLARSPRLQLFTELWPEGLRRSGRSAEAYLGRLSGLGFDMHVIDERLGRLVPFAGVADLARYRNVFDVPNYGLSLLCRRG